MTFIVEYSDEAKDDLFRLIGFLSEKDEKAARRGLQAIRSGVAMLELFPFSCRKAGHSDPSVRELVVPFGSAGYVVLFKILGDDLVYILAIRHQLEEDYQ